MVVQFGARDDNYHGYRGYDNNVAWNAISIRPPGILSILTRVRRSFASYRDDIASPEKEAHEQKTEISQRKLYHYLRIEH